MDATDLSPWHQKGGEGVFREFVEKLFTPKKIDPIINEVILEQQ